jgi:hypothetical protein
VTLIVDGSLNMRGIFNEGEKNDFLWEKSRSPGVEPGLITYPGTCQEQFW